MRYGLIVSVCILLAMLNLQTGLAQEANHWYFGRGIGLDFNVDPPAKLDDAAIFFHEGMAAVSDRDGELLFYTDGVEVYNRNHIQMPNGFDLFGAGTTKQSAIIVPWPDSAHLYFLFTSAFQHTGDYNYSVIDITKDAGLGDVVVKNEVLFGLSTEKLSAVRQENTRNYWLVGQKWATDQFYAFPVTSSGVGVPVISSGGPIVTDDDGAHFMRFNGRGDRMVFEAGLMPGTLTFANFNRSSGEFSDFRTTQPGSLVSSIEFSPNDRWLYVGFYNGEIRQYDMSSPTPSALFNSDSTILDISPNIYLRSGLGPDGKIYGATSGNYLGVITYPDSSRDASLPVENGVHFPGFSPTSVGMPNFMAHQVRLPRIHYEEGCVQEALNYHTSTYSPLDSVIWNFGDPVAGPDNVAYGDSVSHNFTGGGMFEITVAFLRWGYWDTTRCLIHIDVPPISLLPSDTIFISGGTVLLDATWPGATYLWSTGSTSSSILVDSAGTYEVIVTSALGCSNTYLILVEELSGPSGIPEIERQFIVYPNPSSGILNVEFLSLDNWTIQIFNVNGQLIKTAKPHQLNWTRDFSDLTDGLYIISIFNNSVINQRIPWIKTE